MLKKLTDHLTPKYGVLRSSTILTILFLVAFLLRFPFFFRDYIDRDESTFILMGQSWIDGHLPYTELWDLKPPIVFLFFAGIIYTFGKSFFAIRLVGTLIVAITAFFTYKVGEQVGSKKIGFWAGICCVMLLSMFGSLQGVMSEHICMVFFMPGLYLILKHGSWYWYLLAGILMGLSLMTKLNMAYPVLFLGLFIIYIWYMKRTLPKGILNFLLYGTGVLLVIALTIIPYYLNDQTSLWWKSVILAPIEYTGARRYSVLGLAPICILLIGAFLFAWKKKLLDFGNIDIQLLTATAIEVVFSFLKGGRVNGHYLIQLFPVLIVLVVLAVSRSAFFKRINYRPYIMIVLLLLPMESYLEFGAIAKNKIQKGRFYNGEGIDVPLYIAENRIDTKNILFLEYHIGYWLLDKLPPTKAATHPSNIFRDELFPFYNNPRNTGMEELRFIMEVIKPKTVVVRKNKRVFDKKVEEGNAYIDSYLEQHYKLHATVGRAEVLQRLE
ncbi:ArnT family glycosyltransferase [Spongiimicrobium sp. 3-5]|uniref:ArnT family glycosyltransferase n=1 Tax=Spongiimicrobium sp. 3-5 TaxID=3332596 RepID=UPI00397FB73E